MLNLFRRCQFISLIYSFEICAVLNWRNKFKFNISPDQFFIPVPTVLLSNQSNICWQRIHVQSTKGHNKRKMWADYNKTKQNVNTKFQPRHPSKISSNVRSRGEWCSTFTESIEFFAVRLECLEKLNVLLMKFWNSIKRHPYDNNAALLKIQRANLVNKIKIVLLKIRCVRSDQTFIYHYAKPHKIY